MFKNYLKTAYRFLLKSKTFSFINIFGLALGTLCCLYILLYVADQYSYDKYYDHDKDIYRVTTSLDLTGDKHNFPAVSPPIVPAMKTEFGEVQQFTRVVITGMMGVPKHLLTYKDKSFYEQDELYVDSTFFDIFNFHFLGGNPRTVLSEPYSVVLLQPTAIKLFGHDDPIGKTISISDSYGQHDFKVTGVIDESLRKSHIHANIFVAMNSGGIGEYVRNYKGWAGNNFVIGYVRLVPGADPAALEKKLPDFINRHGAEELKAVGMKKSIHFEPVRNIHTDTQFETDFVKSVSPTFLYTMLLIAALIQFIACINFMNLSTARASKRAKEVGVRKVIGAGRNELIRQFLGESFLLALIGVGIALPLLVLLMPELNEITKAQVSLSYLSDYRVWIFLVGLVGLTGLIAGSYPAFYLSAFQATKVIKGNFTSHISAAGIRRALVVFQFVLSIVLIAGIIVIYCQLDYIKNKDLGFDQNQKLIFSFYTGESQGRMQAFINDIHALPEVGPVSKSNYCLTSFVLQDHGVYLEGSDMAHAVDAKDISTDEFFVKANGIRIIGGRDFHEGDSSKVLINEALAKRLGLSLDKAPGTRLYTQYVPAPRTFVTVVGVMKDFNYNSLHQEISPMLIDYNPNHGDLATITASVRSDDYRNLVSKIGAIWHKDLSSTPFEYDFLDAKVRAQYEAEFTLSHILNSFTLMAILISCIGLFGLAAFSAEQRNKEIGVRKVLGAGVAGIVGLLSKEFLRLVFIAVLLAVPISWWVMNKWLESFAYRVPVSWWMFALAGLLAILIALVTVSSQAIKAARANPVKSLRSE